MNESETMTIGQEPTTLYCPRCGKPMLIAPQHMQVPVACPHCSQTLEPWRLAAPAGGPAQGPGAGFGTPQHQPPPPPHAAYAHGPGYAYGYPGYAVSWRNRWVAGALGVLLGGFGVHRFYLGFVGIGIWQIVATVLTVGIVGPIWGFIEGILCFCGAMRDVDGLPLRS